MTALLGYILFVQLGAMADCNAFSLDLSAMESPAPFVLSALKSFEISDGHVGEEECKLGGLA